MEKHAFSDALNLRVGDEVWLDEKYSDRSKVTILELSPMGLQAKITDGNSTWTTMTYRLTHIK